MLQKLRNLNQDSKRKIALATAGTLTFFVFIFWVFSFGGALIDSVTDAKTKSANVFSVFKDGVGKAYDNMNKMVPKNFSGIINNNTNTGVEATATTTGM